MYGAEISRQTISTIIDEVLEGMVDGRADSEPVYPAVFIDAIHVRSRDRQVHLRRARGHV
jgi:transposase-like protein